MFHPTLRQLQVFEAVARHRSFSRAAEELHLSQPGVSMQVKQLGDMAGLPLVEQIGKKIFLTEAGQLVYQCCQNVAQQIGGLEERLAQMKGLDSGELKISAVSTTKYFAPRLLAAFSQRHPQLSVRLDVGNREKLLAALAENDVDLVIMGKPPEGLDLEAHAFMDNPLVIIAPPHHPLARKRKLPATKLEGETFIMREPGSGTRAATERFFAEHRAVLTPGMEMNSNIAIQQAVEAGLGLGLVSRHTLGTELKLGRLVVLDVEDTPIIRHWYIVHRPGKRFSSAALSFIDFIRSDAARLMAAD
jgi:LysR family transcriptional regulator, low CO2-responsive transcriptional regulator